MSTEVSQLKIALDIGSSGNKGYNFFSGRYFELDNSIVFPQDTFNSKDWVSKNSLITDSLDLVIKRKGIEREIMNNVNTRVLVGDLAKIASPFSTKVNSSTGKVDQINTYFNVIACITAEMLKNKIEEADIKLGVLLPPTEAFNETREDFINNLSGDYEISLPAIGKEIKFTLSTQNILVLPECYTSFAYACFDDRGQLTKVGRDMEDKLVLGIDIGASTTDITGFKNFKPLSYTFDTFRYAGNFVITELINSIAKQHRGYKPTHEECEIAMITGELARGNSKIDIRKNIDEAKKTYTLRFTRDFADYLNSREIHPYSVAGLLFVGGGSIETSATESLGSYILKSFNQTCPETIGIFVDKPRKSNLEGLVRYMRSIEE